MASPRITVVALLAVWLGGCSGSGSGADSYEIESSTSAVVGEHRRIRVQWRYQNKTKRPTTAFWRNKYLRDQEGRLFAPDSGETSDTLQPTELSKVLTTVFELPLAVSPPLWWGRVEDGEEDLAFAIELNVEEKATPCDELDRVCAEIIRDQPGSASSYTCATRGVWVHSPAAYQACAAVLKVLGRKAKPPSPGTEQEEIDAFLTTHDQVGSIPLLDVAHVSTSCETRSEQEIRTVIQERIRTLNVCVMDQKMRKEASQVPDPLVLTFALAPQGKAVNLKLKHRDFRSGPFKSCMSKVFGMMKFPATRGSKCPIEVTIKTGQDGEGQPGQTSATELKGGLGPAAEELKDKLGPEAERLKKAILDEAR